jgi:hypothetical protein
MLTIGIIADNFADEIILDPCEIAKRYMRSWFILDFVRYKRIFVYNFWSVTKGLQSISALVTDNLAQ